MKGFTVGKAWEVRRPSQDVLPYFARFACGSCEMNAAARFDSEGETWGDMLRALRAIGWVVDVENGWVREAWCAACAKPMNDEGSAF